VTVTGMSGGLYFRALSTRIRMSSPSAIYDGAPHSFFDRKQERFADASADAWRRVLGFLEKHTPA
jgi:carboxymethylenebutenolidase